MNGFTRKEDAGDYVSPASESELFTGKLKLDSFGRIPAVLQDCQTRDVAGLVYMDEQSLSMTLGSKRLALPDENRLSGFQVPVFYALVDCDEDSLLIGIAPGRTYGIYMGEIVKAFDDFSLDCDPDFAGSSGLVPAVVQDCGTGKVLMQAYVNEESLRMTRRTGLATYWNRSRGNIWVKGKSSENFRYVKSVKTSRYRDSVLLSVYPVGPACHTGNVTCFYRKMGGERYG